MRQGCHLLVAVVVAIVHQLLQLVSSDELNRCQLAQFSTVKCNGDVIVCATSQPSRSFDVRSRGQCVRECQHQNSAQNSSCNGVVHREIENRCDLYDDYPTSYTINVPGCQYVKSGVYSAATCSQLTATNVLYIAGDECSYPFTYNGQLYYRCSSLSGVTNNFLQYGCRNSNGDAAICNRNNEFSVSNETLNVTIPTTTIVMPLRTVNGWLTILSRVDASFPVDQSDNNMKFGFGNIMSNFWLGLDYVYRLTNSATNGGHTYRVRFELQSGATGRWYSEEYAMFYLDGSAQSYTLHISSADFGDAGDSINTGSSPNGRPFNFLSGGGVCVSTYGLWWYYDNSGSCCHARLFGSNHACMWSIDVEPDWLQRCRMMIRPQQ